jgi:glycosyltransferase involved in cell wall biosynthesis
MAGVTRDEVQRFPEVIYIRQEDSGSAAARSTGCAAAVGDLFVFLEADDRLVAGARGGTRQFRGSSETRYCFRSVPKNRCRAKSASACCTMSVRHLLLF